MLEVIIPYINSKIETLEMFQKLHGLCELITKEGKTYPAEYCNNEYKQVSDFDKYKGLVYHRLTDNILTEELDEEQTVSCDPFYSHTLPLKTIAIIHKKHLSHISNDAYLESKIARIISGELAGINKKQLRQSLMADSVEISINEIVVDRNEIFDSEYSGIDNFFRYEYLYVSIDYSIIVNSAFSCLINYKCEEEEPADQLESFNSDFNSDFS